MNKKTYKTLSLLLLISIVTGGGWIYLQQEKQNSSEQNPSDIGSTPSTEKQPNLIPVKQSYIGLLREIEELIEKQYYSQASLKVTEAMENKPDLLKPYLLLGEIYIRTQANDKLTALISTLSEKFPNEQQIAVLETRRLVMNLEYEQALTSFEENKDSLPPELLFYHGILLSLQNDHEQSKSLLETLEDYSTDKSEIKVSSEGIVEEKTEEDTISPELKEKTKAILKVYKSFTKVNDGKDPHLFALLSQTLTQYNEAALGKAFAEVALKEDPSYPDAWILRGYASLTLGQHESALKDLEYAYEIAPERSNTLYFLGLTYLETNDLQKSAVFFEKVLKTDFDFSEEVRWKLIDIYTQQKNYDRVIELYSEALEESSNPKDYVDPLQTAIEILKRPDLALEFTEKLLRKNPNDFISYNFHAWALIAGKQFIEAEKTLDTAIEIAPENPGSYLYKGLLYEEQSKFSKAIEFYKKSYDLGKDSSEYGITRIAAQKHNELAQQKNKPAEEETGDREANSP